jgi:hypothetical protein
LAQPALEQINAAYVLFERAAAQSAQSQYPGGSMGRPAKALVSVFLRKGWLIFTSYHILNRPSLHDCVFALIKLSLASIRASTWYLLIVLTIRRRKMKNCTSSAVTLGLLQVVLPPRLQEEIRLNHRRRPTRRTARLTTALRRKTTLKEDSRQKR